MTAHSTSRWSWWSRASSVALLVVCCVTCTVPQIVEDSAAACANGEDDDANGSTDCDDPQCARSGACELDEATCSDGIDQDRDGRVDCEQDSCVRAGFCKAAAADCDVVRRTGCRRGQSCHALDPVGGEPRMCVQPGAHDENEGCASTAEDPAGGCKDGTICYGNGLCSRPCEQLDDCPRSALCIRVDSLPYGVCTLTCFPPAGCADGYSCIAMQWGGIAYAGGGWMHGCVSTNAVTSMVPKATAQVGDSCLDGVRSGSPSERVCSSGLVCVPGATSTENTCRKACLANVDGSDANTCAEGRCVAVDPFDQRPARPSDVYRLGVCL